MTVAEYDDLLTKKTLDENDNFEDFLTSKDHPTKMEVCFVFIILITIITIITIIAIINRF